MSDLADDADGFDPTAAPTGTGPTGAGAPSGTSTGAPFGRGSRAAGGDNGQYGQEIHSVTIHARQRTFYIDLKASTNGKFFKISEKSRGGRKTTIMFDAEDLDAFIGALNEMKTKL